jgi:lipoprotein-anchoring transpeptidase ErfK/SrfK
MRRAVRYLFVVAAIALTAMTGSAATSVAAVPVPIPVPGLASILPPNGAVVGIAHPVVVTFTAPVRNRRAAERAIHVNSPSNTPGHFEWTNSNVVQWVPDQYWPPHTRVSVGVQALDDPDGPVDPGAAPGPVDPGATPGPVEPGATPGPVVPGGTRVFETGPGLRGVASISAHTFTVSRNGEVLRKMPASMGKPSRPTPTGSFTAMSKERTVVMDSRTIGIPLSSSDGYLITASYAVRVTGSGVYVHSAPWSVNSQGYANVSHGCINLSPDNAAWYFNIVNIGDPIDVVA